MFMQIYDSVDDTGPIFVLPGKVISGSMLLSLSLKLSPKPVAPLEKINQNHIMVC